LSGSTQIEVNGAVQYGIASEARATCGSAIRIAGRPTRSRRRFFILLLRIRKFTWILRVASHFGHKTRMSSPMIIVSERLVKGG
jgi:hypothetical protein